MLILYKEGSVHMNQGKNWYYHFQLQLLAPRQWNKTQGYVGKLH